MPLRIPVRGGKLLTTTAKVQIVLDVLQRLYPNPSVPLKRRDPYTHLIAVLLSAQCTDARVNQVTPALFARADRPERMVELAVEEIEQIIRPCGLAPRKSKAIWELSQILLAEHGGQVPPDLAALERLPGVGHKTAQVVLAQNFGVPTFPVDTHIHRLIYRWGLSTGKTSSRRNGTASASFPKSAGTTCTCKSSTSDASTARRVGTSRPSACCAAG